MKRPHLTLHQWLLAGFCAVVLLVGLEALSILLRPGPPPPPPGPYEPEFRADGDVPDFELPDSKGRRHRLSDLAGERTVLSFVCGCKHCIELQRYMVTLRGRMRAYAPRFITVASFDPRREARFLKQTRLPQILLYESPGAPVARQYKAVPAPRVFYLEPGMRLASAGPSPAEDSIYHIGSSLAAALHFESPFLERGVRKAPEPRFLDRSEPARRPVGEPGGQRLGERQSATPGPVAR